MKTSTQKNYLYTIFEINNKGYILKEKYLYSSSEEEDVFLEFAEQIEEKLTKQTINEIIEEIGYLNSYDIKNHKAKIKTTTQTPCRCIVVCRSEDKKRENIMYLILSNNKRTDFSNVPRYEASRETICLKDLKNEHNEESVGDLFLN